MRYGFQRLALLNSAGYQRAELPLDAAVSLIAPNNAGKTSLINALQFLLIIDKRRMDFGAHEVDTSRRFYFPHNSAYILLEVALPTTGTVVLGCVGKGVSHDYEYFAYKGELDLEHYRLPDGSTVPQPALRDHMLQFGQLVYTYSPSEFADALYGGRRHKRQDNEPDFTVFKLEQVSNAAIFQRVLTRTLRLDRLNSAEVKTYLLEIFRNDLPDASIDFKAEWDKAFAEVNADRAQYDAAMKQRPLIATLERDHDARRVVRGKLLHFRPLIDARLGEWDAYQREEKTRRLAEQARVEAEEDGLTMRDRDLVKQQGQASGKFDDLQKLETRLTALSRNFELIAGREVLEQRHSEIRGLLDAQIALVHQADNRSVASIQRDIAANVRDQQRCTSELETLADNLYLRLRAQLDDGDLERLNRALAGPVMTLSPTAFELDPARLKDWLQGSRDNAIALPGLALDVRGLAPQHEQRSRDQIQGQLAELRALAPQLQQQLAAGQAIDAARAQKAQLQRDVESIAKELTDYDEMLQLRAGQDGRALEMAALKARLEEIAQLLVRSKDEATRLRAAHKDVQARITRIEDQNEQIVRLRNRRGDDAPVFDLLGDLPHQPWLGSDEVALATLAEDLQTYQRDCATLVQLNERIGNHVATLHAGGLTKYLFSDNPETEIDQIVRFAAHLPQEAEALERKARTAVVNVTACLRELRDGLLRFQGKMREFNRLVNRRQLSDLEVFKIEPVEETAMVEAMAQLISTAEQAGSGETFELFNHQSVLDDATLNRAKTLLIEEGAVRGCLKVEHFFRLEFVVAKTGRKPESFTDIDSAASNGTVLMAKLVTGLALLHQMKDKRHNVQAVCYLDEASALDQRNQRSLIETANDFGFALIFASPAPLITARYCVPITTRGGHNLISRQSWQIIESLEPNATHL
ncbi:MAG: hypothetical protein C0607_22290 [Azoarcus sp.]|nr:MAG: hypothetical protein C0607_22290 [Azoarcus sp.]